MKLPLILRTGVLIASLLATSHLYAGDVDASKETTSKQVVPPDETVPVVHPVSGPYFNEDSFITTDIRLWYAHQTLTNSPLGGGHATDLALQLRVAILKNLQFVAYKDGWLDINTPGLKKNGWNNIAAGLKFAYLQNEAARLNAAIGVGYEFASGYKFSLQDYDELRLWTSVNKGIGKLNLGATFNYFAPLHNGSPLLGTAQRISWHLHADYAVCQWFSPVFEINGYQVLADNNKSPISGADIANLGGNSGEPVITAAVGAEFRPVKHLAVRGAWEMPLNDTKLFGNRVTCSAVITF